MCYEGADACYEDPPGVSSSNSSRFTLCLSSGDCYEYPRSYGSGACAAHDSSAGPCGGADAPSWCGEAWCYVDAELCALGGTTYAMGAFIPVAYSYETCGGDASLWDDDVSRALVRGKTVRAAIPWLLSPYHYVAAPDGSRVEGPVPNGTVEGLAGAYVELLEHVALLGEFAIDWTKTSTGALRQHASPWDACLEDVRDGRADVCVGNLWTTFARLEEVTFTTAVTDDPFYLFVPRGTARSESFLKRLRTPFQPFSLRLWVSIAGVVLVTGLVTAHLSEGTLEGTFPERAALVCYQTLMENLGGVVDSYNIVGAGDMLAQRLVKIFFGFFVLVTTTLYTANLAAILSQSAKVRLPIKSIDDCATHKCALCVHSQTYAYASSTLGSEAIRLVRGGWTAAENMDALERGACDALLLAFSDYATLDHSDAFSDAVARYQYVAQPVISYPEALAIKDAYAKPISRFLRQLIEDGTYASTWTRFAGDLRTDPFVDDAAADSDSDIESLSVVQGLGPVALMLIALFAAFVLHETSRPARTARHSIEAQINKHLYHSREAGGPLHERRRSSLPHSRAAPQAAPPPGPRALPDDAFEVTETADESAPDHEIWDNLGAFTELECHARDDRAS